MIQYIITNQNVTVILQKLTDDGFPTVKHIDLEKANMTVEQFQSKVEGMADDEFLVTFAPTEVNEKELTLVESKAFEDLEGFNTKDGSLYLNGVPISIPKELAQWFLNCDNEDDMEAWKNFWRRLVSCENTESRESAYGFLKHHKMELTQSGHILCYRNVEDVSTTLGFFEQPKLYSKFMQFKSEIKKWKKGLKKYDLYSNNAEVGEYKIFKVNSKKTKGYSYLGNMKEFDQGIFADTKFTDRHTRTFEIRKGEVVSLERDKCDFDARASCSNGLHVGTESFVRSGSFGDVGIAVLVDPFNIVAVPNYDSHKMRVSSYLPIAPVSFDKSGALIPISLSNIEDIMFYDKKLTDESKFSLDFLRNLTLAEIQGKRILPNDITMSAFDTITLNHKEMSAILAAKVIRA
jgi:hypothetical protein|tara:strand:- start:1344 stop:2558 length:1215 start_codon:yes stop_codon:yes gene_type:complete